MGGCVSHDRNNHRRRSHSSRSSATPSGTIARNKPLNRSTCRPKWKSDVPITDTQLRRKREEYWDTAPAFEGRKEIWDALRGACYAIEQNDIDLAQSIINCANISLPRGTLLDCYDELGTRYQLPVYILSAPINLIDAEQLSNNDNESNSSEVDLTATAVADRERDYSDNHQSSIGNQQRRIIKSPTDGLHNPIVREIKKHRRKQKSTGDSSSYESSSANATTSSIPALNNDQQSSIDQDIEIPIKFRLSNGNEHRLFCKANEKIRNVKRRLAILENGAIDLQTQRLYFGGKLLHDRVAICETRLQRNFVVQVILQDQPMPPNGAITTTGHLTTSNYNNYSTPVEFPDSSIMEQF
ncbi:unnamed protein product [Rotaria socialis]|uniref:Ubiquitin-like domain-containing protein n=1 Tax=Rotaria socialis TaxID=392032 RepID=A0A817VLM1_9BILA|nr:unnamed protein product [Rotaria socialis]CAF4555143.1 unnamed protein product [Rotaria socialis]